MLNSHVPVMHCIMLHTMAQAFTGAHSEGRSALQTGVLLSVTLSEWGLRCHGNLACSLELAAAKTNCRSRHVS